MDIQVIGITAAVLGILTFLWKVATFAYRESSKPKGYAVVLSAMLVMLLLTFVGVVVLLTRSSLGGP
jgi:hypothetical protein